MNTKCKKLICGNKYKDIKTVEINGENILPTNARNTLGGWTVSVDTYQLIGGQQVTQLKPNSKIEIVWSRYATKEE